jgi:hypothetical protein
VIKSKQAKKVKKKKYPVISWVLEDIPTPVGRMGCNEEKLYFKSLVTSTVYSHEK